MEKKELKPAGVFRFFEEICQIPRPSKHEEKIIAYLQEFGKSHGLKTTTDTCGNVLIEKPASPGMENRKTVVLQAHMDMVPDKRKDVEHDFLKDPIETWIDGEWLKAKGTTLGADNGIGVATGLAVLDDDSIEHGPLECLFTRDEETGLTGAFEIQDGFMHGDILLNLDSEDEGQIFISCAGGANTIATFHPTMEPAPEGQYFFKLQVSGLTGGHSGDDIVKKRANANKLLVRILAAMRQYGVRIADIQSGGLHNAIPRDGFAVCCVPMEHKEAVRVLVNTMTAELKETSARMKELSDLIRYAEGFKRLAPVYKELNAIKFKKKREAFAADHESELRLFHLAKRKLDAAAPDHKIPLSEWKKELTELSESFAEESEKLKPIRAELKELYSIKSKLDTILRQQSAQEINENRKENYAQEKETH